MYPVKDDAGRVDEIVLVHLDVTDQRRAEEALRASEGRLRSLVEQSAAGIAQTDLTGRIAFANRRYCEIVGYPPEEVVGLRVHDLTHPDDRAETTRLVAGGAATGGEYAMEKRYVRRDGSVVWVAVSASVFKDAAGNPQSIMGVVIDVSDRKRAEAALAASEARFRQIADAMPQMVWVTRPDGFHEYYNRRWYEFTGAADGSTDGEGWNAMFHPDDRARAWERWRHSLATGEPYEVEYRLRHHTGEYRWTLGRALAIRDGGGAVERWFGTCTDIDAMRRLTDERVALLASERAARAEAERQGRLKDEFLANLSHELRTPLNAILGWAQLLLGSGTPDEQDLRQGLETIERNARAQKTIIEDLLDMSRIVAGTIKIDVQKVDLAAVIGAAAATVRHAAEAKGVRLEVVLDARAGPVSGDPARLQQVLWNLLSNSVKHCERGGRVQVVLARADSHVEVRVIDDGEGISPNFLPFVFDRFRQADGTTTRRHGGLGLGLSIVKQLVELHGGNVRATSPGVGRGATFTVTLPLSATLTEPEARPARARPETGRHGDPPGDDHRVALDGVRVLVVDDDPDARVLLRKLLEDRAAVVTVAASADEAMERLRAGRHDVLVSDIGLPETDGYELLRRVRALPADEGGAMPAVALTAYARAEDRAKALLAGFQHHVAKPVEPAELTSIVAVLAGQPRR